MPNIEIRRPRPKPPEHYRITYDEEKIHIEWTEEDNLPRKVPINFRNGKRVTHRNIQAARWAAHSLNHHLHNNPAVPTTRLLIVVALTAADRHVPQRIRPPRRPVSPEWRVGEEWRGAWGRWRVVAVNKWSARLVEIDIHGDVILDYRISTFKSAKYIHQYAEVPYTWMLSKKIHRG